jgi:hypothetical protein
LLNRILTVFYKVGLIGIRKKPSDETRWSYLNETTIAVTEISDNARVYIHRAFWKTLGIKVR